MPLPANAVNSFWKAKSLDISFSLCASGAIYALPPLNLTIVAEEAALIPASLKGMAGVLPIFTAF